MKVLVIAAHPDDEVLGVGGAIAKHSKKGDKVKVVILGEGITSRNPNNAEELLSRLKEDSRRANRILGVEEVYFHSYPDNSFDSVPLLDIIKTIESHVNEFKPDIVYTHFWGDLNIDHKITYRAVITACRPIKSIKKLLCFEILSSTEQNVQIQQNVFTPNFYLNIEQELKLKVEAIKEYKSEIQKYPYPRSAEGIEILAKYRGLAIGCNAAEAFFIAREKG